MTAPLPLGLRNPYRGYQDGTVPLHELSAHQGYEKGAAEERAQIVRFLQRCTVAACSPSDEAVFRMALRAAAVMVQEGVHTKEEYD